MDDQFDAVVIGVGAYYLTGCFEPELSLLGRVVSLMAPSRAVSGRPSV
jgi:hypothetical protein